MTKKIIMSILAIIILSMCCGVCFAEENNNSINLGNELMQSVDKTGESFRNVVSENIMKDSSNMIRNGDYNVTRTVVPEEANNNTGAMTTTTWMWIILAVAAVIIIAAIWYYATQNNS